MQYPFAQNAEIVDLIMHDLFWAMFAVPVMFYAAWRLLRASKESNWFGVARGLSMGVSAAGWLAYFLSGWVIPTPIALDLSEIRRNAPSVAWLGKGRIGYFDCTLSLGPTAKVPWSARKLATFKKDGSRYLWIEGNADEPAVVVEALKAVNPILRNGVPSVAAVEAQVKVQRDNRVPMFAQPSGSVDAVVLIFREPNMLVTPCLLLRY